MFRYLILNVLVMLAVAAVLYRCDFRALKTKKLVIVVAVLLVLTAVFDSLIVGLDLVSYNLAHILGVYIGRAPIEDFSYTITAAIIVPLLWERAAKK